MKKIGEMTIEELGGLICQTLGGAGIQVTLTGGACVTIWSIGKYVSYDLDFIEEGPVSRRSVRRVLETLGFKQERYFVEFPTGPLMVGGERVERVSERATPGRHAAPAVPDGLRERSARSVLSLARPAIT